MSSIERHGINTPIPDGFNVVVIDHHKSNKGWGMYNIVDTCEMYPSTCSMLYEICSILDINLTKNLATLLLTGVSGDTGFFMYGVTSKVLKDSAELFAKGADYELIKRKILGSMDISELHFMSQVFSQAEINKDAVIIPISNDTWVTYGKASYKNEFVVYYLNKIDETRCGILIIEEEPRVLRFEFRSRDIEFDVSELAIALGGGGHKNAAGATIKDMTLSEAIEKVKKLL
jgi:phosphoesterase RecJ-like protein